MDSCVQKTKRPIKSHTKKDSTREIEKILKISTKRSKNCLIRSTQLLRCKTKMIEL